MTNVATSAQAAKFTRELLRIVPQLRSYAISLCGKPDRAEDLVQEALLRAWAARERFGEDTSIRAWTFTILKNFYISGTRRNRFCGDYDEDLAMKILICPAEQEGPLHLSDTHRAMMTLSKDRRLALLLIAIEGLTYDEAAAICGCETGTVKSRVSRGRAEVVKLVEGNSVPRRSKTDVVAHEAIFAEINEAMSAHEKAAA